MKLYFCENDTKGNHYVVAGTMIIAVDLFTKSAGVYPDKVTICDETVIMETNLSLVKDGNND